MQSGGPREGPPQTQVVNQVGFAPVVECLAKGLVGLSAVSCGAPQHSGRMKTNVGEVVETLRKSQPPLVTPYQNGLIAFVPQSKQRPTKGR